MSGNGERTQMLDMKATWHYLAVQRANRELRDKYNIQNEQRKITTTTTTNIQEHIWLYNRDHGHWFISSPLSSKNLSNRMFLSVYYAVHLIESSPKYKICHEHVTSEIRKCSSSWANFMTHIELTVMSNIEFNWCFKMTAPKEGCVILLNACCIDSAYFSGGMD